MTRTSKVVKNILFSIGSKGIMFILGIVIPRLIIISYGSESNGLLSSTGNIFNYIALIEAGISTAALQALYGPVAHDDRRKISEILVATQNYYRRLIKWYVMAVVVFALVYPLVVTSEISYFTIFLVIIIPGFSSVLTYYYASTVMQILSADGREYVSQVVALIAFVANSVVKIGLMMLGADIIALQIGYLVLNVVQIIFYRGYVKKHYGWIDWNAEPDNTALANRKRYLLNGVAWTVFNSTDTFVISIMCGFKYSSIYAIYNLVFANLNMIFSMFYSSSYFVLGQTYHEDKEKYLFLHDGLESLVSTVMFALLTVAYVLALPFVAFYTRGITDIIYVDKYLPFLFVMVQLLSNCRMFSGNLINVCNRPDMTNKASMIEVIMNITLSIGLTYFIGFYGVLIGTIVGLLYKTTLIIVRSNRQLLNRSPLRTFSILGGNFALFFLTIYINSKIEITINSYLELAIYGVVLSIVFLVLYALVNFALNPKSLQIMKNFIVRVIKKSNA